MGPTILAAITLVAFAAGGIAASIAWSRRGGALAGLVGAFALGALRQALVLWSGPPTAPSPLDQAAEAAFLGLALCGLAALRAQDRTTRERDRIEDLHWESMETVRRLTEVPPAEDDDLEARVARLTGLGVERFGMERGAVWLRDSDEVRWLGTVGDAHARRVLEPLAHLLERAARASRPVRIDLADAEPRPRVLFAAPLPCAGERRGALAFLGDAVDASSGAPTRFGATDKDLLALMAAGIAAEIGRETDTGTEVDPEPVPGPDPRPRRGEVADGHDLSRSVQVAERRLRRAIGADATLAFELAPDLPALRPVGMALPRLVESLVLAAARLAPTGHIAVGTRPPDRDNPAQEPARDATLVVQVDDASLTPDALERLFAPAGDPDGTPSLEHGLPLSQVERRLQRADGDLSVSLEPGRRAVLTAYLPVAAPGAVRPARRAETPSPR